MKRRIILILGTAVIVMGFGGLLNRISFNPEFSVTDVISGASKKVDKDKQTSKGNSSNWKYKAEDFQLSTDGGQYSEETICIDQQEYVVLWNRQEASKKKSELIILSNQENEDYEEGVSRVADYYRSKGYRLKTVRCSEIKMCSYAHAGHFDLLLLRKEAVL